MILKGNQRGGAKDLALHLLKDENDHVEVHELRGFASDNLMGALNESYAISRGTKCRQYLYSLSLNPPETAQVNTETFIAAIEKTETKLGLSGQPRAIVFHEKEGRRHAHAVWSRIDITAMKAIQMSHDHTKLQQVSRELYLEHGWTMPRGLANPSKRDPRNFTLAEWQQAKRTGQNARDIKTAFQDAWAISDNKAAFTHALEERGYKLARGDRRGFVAVDIHGEVWSVPRQANVKTKAVRERLGSERDLPSVAEASAALAKEMSATMDRHKAALDKERHIKAAEAQEARQQLVEAQRAARKRLVVDHRKRQTCEALARQARFRKGLGGVWDRLRGEHKRIQKQNEAQAQAHAKRDAYEKEQLIVKQLNQRRMLKRRMTRSKEQFIAQRREITADKARLEHQREKSLEDLRAEFIEKSKARRKPPDRPPRWSRRSLCDDNTPNRSRGPSLDR